MESDDAGEPQPRRRSVFKDQSANALSLARLILAAAWAFLAATNRDTQLLLGTIAIAAAVSDIVDGRVARRFAIASGSGRWLDATADVTFILVALFFKAEEGAIPVYIPVLIAASFSQFAFDSLILARASSGPIKSRLGHWGGIINYGLVIVLAAASRSIQTAVRIAAPLLAAFYLAAIAERAWLFYRAR